MQTIFSSKGQVVIPAAIRNAVGFKAGMKLHVIATGNGEVTLKAIAPGKYQFAGVNAMTVDQAASHFKSLWPKKSTKPKSSRQVRDEIADAVSEKDELSRAGR